MPNLNAFMCRSWIGRLSRTAAMLFLALFASFAWSSNALAVTVACEIAATSSTFQQAPGGGSVYFTFAVVDTGGGCSGTVSGEVVLTGDGTGGATTSLPTWSGSAASTFTVTVNLGPNPGQSVSVNINCLSGCFNGANTIKAVAATDNLYEFLATTPTTVVTNDLTPVDFGVNLKFNGTAASEQIRFDNVTTSTILDYDYPDGNGDASTQQYLTTPGNYQIDAVVLCIIIPVTSSTCPPPNISFYVTVEQTTLSAANQSYSILPGDTQALQVDYRSPSLPAPDGSYVSWAVVQSPSGGDATLDGQSNTSTGTTNGSTSVSFNASVPGTYKVRAANTCQVNCFAPSFVDFTVVVIDRRLQSVSGSGQSGPTNQTLANPLVVRALDNTTPAAGIAINWTVVAGTATLSPSGATDASGYASTTVTFGNVAGPVTVRAERGDDPTAFVTFRVTAQAVKELAEVSGNGQSAPGGSALPAPLVVLASDNGLPAAGVSVKWSVFSGQATLSPLISNSDAAGEASTSVVLGNAAGAVVVRATRLDDSNEFVDFNLSATGTTPVKSVIKVSGDNQSGPLNGSPANPLVARALNDGAPVSGVGIDWSVIAGNASVSSGSTSTDGNGDASVTVSFGNSFGLVKVRAARQDDASQFVDFTLTAVAPTPVVKTIVKVSGDNQSAPVNSSLPLPLVARALNDGVATAGIDIGWTVLSGSASVTAASSTTDGSGDASTSVNFGSSAGPVIIRAARLDDASKYVDFNLTVTAAVVKSIIKVSGDGQSGPVDTTLPQALVVRALNDGSPVAAVGIGWSVISGSASVSPNSGSSNGAGEASTTVTLGASPGTVIVRATRLDDASQFVDFSLSATLVRTLLLVSGNNQQATLGEALANPLVVQAVDNGIAKSGVTINWSVVSGSGSLSPTASVTSGSGQTQSALTLGNTAGTVTVKAARGDDPSVYVTFTASATQPPSLADLPGLSETQHAVAEALDSFCPEIGATGGGSGGGSDGGGEGFAATATATDLDDLRERCEDLYDAYLSDPDGVLDALDQLFSDIALVQTEAGLIAARSQFENIKVRIAALRSGTQRTSFGGLSFNSRSGQFPLGLALQSLAQDGGSDKQDSASAAGFSRWGFFVAGSIGRVEADPGDVTPGYDSDITGLTIGLDYRKSDRLIFGGTLGYTRQTDDLVNNEGSLETTGWSASLFGTWYKADSWYADAVLSWGQNSFDIERSVHYVLQLPGGPVTVDQHGRSESDGDSLSFAATFGRDFNKNGWGFGPYLRVLYTQLSFDEIVEEMDAGQNGSGLALVIDGRDINSLSSVLGGKLTYAHSTGWGVLIPHLQFEWQHEFDEDPSAVTAHFLNDPTATPFSVTGDALDTDYFRFGLGMSFVLAKGRSGFFFYEKTFSQERLSQDRFALGLRIEF
jgi:uncharacterized protein YhjY with autotransporter beta-barrel domain